MRILVGSWLVQGWFKVRSYQQRGTLLHHPFCHASRTFGISGICTPATTERQHGQHVLTGGLGDGRDVRQTERETARETPRGRERPTEAERGRECDRQRPRVRPRVCDRERETEREGTYPPKPATPSYSAPVQKMDASCPREGLSNLCSSANRGKPSGTLNK